MADKQKKEPGKLPPAVDAKFSVAPGMGCGEIGFKGSNYDLTKITVETAEQLVKDGCTALVPKTTQPTKKD